MRKAERKPVVMSRIHARDKYHRALTLVDGKTQEVFTDIGKRIFAGNEGNHYLGLSLEDPGKISYARRLQDRHDQRRRMKTTIGKYLKRNFGEATAELRERDIDFFTSRWTSLFKDSSFVKFQTGQDIVDRYAEKFGCGSCMTEEDSQYTVMYAEDNAENVKMLIYNDGESKARAMIFIADCGATIIDRVYPNDSPAIPVLKKYAREKGWWMRTDQNLPDGIVSFADKSGRRCSDFSVTVNVARDDYDDAIFPYMDSFRFANYDDESTVTLCTERTGCTIVLDSCSGCYSGIENGKLCSCCEEYHDEDSTWYDVTLGDDREVCANCFARHYFTCVDCGENYSDDCAMGGPDGETYCDGCYEQRFTDCDLCSETVDREDIYEAFGERKIDNDLNVRYSVDCCQGCFDELQECDSCNERTTTDLKETEDGDFCNACQE